MTTNSGLAVHSMFRLDSSLCCISRIRYLSYTVLRYFLFLFIGHEDKLRWSLPGSPGRSFDWRPGGWSHKALQGPSKPASAIKNQHKRRIFPLLMRNYSFQFKNDATARCNRFHKFANTHCTWFTVTWDMYTGTQSFSSHVETCNHLAKLIVHMTPMVRPRRLRREHHHANNNFSDFTRECIHWDCLQCCDPVQLRGHGRSGST